MIPSPPSPPSISPKTQETPNFIVLGMAPGKVEDNKGVPFVGPAGTLLRNELRRQSIDPTLAYYMNVVSCAPPNNKVKSTHIDACRQNLKDQLDVADAEWVLVCGNLAMETLLPHANGYTRGKVISVHGKKLWCVYHPSYILQSRDRQVYLNWQIQLLMFGFIIEGTEFEDDSCIYCGEESAFALPVCRKCVKFWKIDSKWRYSPPPQLRLEL
jgi:uracil-DNA glycosylase